MVGIHVIFEWIPTLYASFIMFDHFSLRKLQKMQKLSKIQITCHGTLIWSYKAMKKMDSQMDRFGLFEPPLLNMVIFGHAWIDPNFCKQVGMPMVGIYAMFECIPTLCESCITSGHFSSRKLQKMQELSKTETAWHGALNWPYKTKKKLEPF